MKALSVDLKEVIDNAPNLVQYKIVLIDESTYYDPELLAECGGKIVRAFLFDSLKQVNCCEITPSYEMIPLESTCAGYISEDIEEQLRLADANDNDIKYFHCRYIDSLSTHNFYVYAPYTLKDAETYEEVEAQYEEDSKCNVKIECPWTEEYV